MTHFRSTVWFESVNLVNFNTGFLAFCAFLLGQTIPGIMELTVTPKPMWVATASGRLTGPAAVWFTNWAS
ncbi:hypothetical protein DSO57_1030596 [Entomophthora muscae]|uniref:Uncharacterized protein n=1 Tax=Entomophthora muscae TaxID=34485 RepID=A0ACC2T0X2_9FUNG|nr:hypothetical protein DSO57_1030596 [Entomophthora muscae]